jgi:hypothetical protein
MLKLITNAFVEHAARLRRVAAIAAAAAALGGAGQASAEIIFDNVTGPASAPTSSGGYVVGEYSPGSVYALGGVFTVPLNGPLDLVGGSIAVSFDAASTGINEMDLAIADDIGGADPVGAIVATATISNLPTALTSVDFTTPEAQLTPGASYWLLASMPDSTATAYWWAADIPQGAYPVAVAYNGGVFMLGSHTQPVMFTIDAVPEPSTWAMVLVGFVLIAWVAAGSRPTAIAWPLVSGRRGGSSGDDNRRSGDGNSGGWSLNFRSLRRRRRRQPPQPDRPQGLLRPRL